MQLPEGFVLDQPKVKTGPVYGPAPKVDPYKEEDQQFQRAANARAEEDQRRQIEKDRLAVDKDRLAIDRDRAKLEATGGIDASVEQGRAATFALRATEANAGYEQAGLDPDSTIGKIGSQSGFEIVKDTTAYFSEDKRNAQRSRERNFIAAVLRYESGAAIPPSEYETAYQIYFPSPSAGPEEIETKRQARQNAIDGLRLGAGPNVARVDGLLQSKSANQSGENPLGITVDPAVLAQQGPNQGDPNRPNPGVLYGDPRATTREGLEQPKVEYEVSSTYATDEDKQIAATLNSMFRRGASLQELIAKGNEFAAQTGGRYRPWGPDDIAQMERAIQYRNKNGPYDAVTPATTGQRNELVTAAGRASQSTAGAILTGIGNGATLGGIDELAGVIGGDDYAAQVQGAKDAAAQNNALAYFGGNIGGNVASLAALPASAASKLATVPGMIGTGAVSGALEMNDNRLLGAATGGALGWAVPKGLNAVAPYVGNALAPVGNAVKNMLPGASARNALTGEVTSNANVVQAGIAENIPVRLPDVAPSTRGRFQELKASDGGGPVVGRVANDDLAAVESRVAEIGGGGTAKEPYNMGADIQSAVSREKDKIAREASAFYRRAEMQAPNFKAAATQVSQDIDAKIAGIKAVAPEGNEGHIGLLEKIKGNFEKTGLSTETLQANRDIVRRHVKDNNLAFSAQEVELLDTIKVAGQEYEQALRASGNEAAAATLARANEKWAEYSDFKKQVAKTLIGTSNQPVYPEQAAKRLMAMVKAGGNSDKFARVFRSLDDTEKADFRALVAENLGKGQNGEFTFAMLARNLDQKQASYQALREVFGPDGFKSLMNLKALAAAKRDAMIAPIGTSTRREVGGLKRLLLGFFGIAGGAGAGGVPGAVAGGMVIPAISKMGERRAARLMLNKDVTNLLRQAPETDNPKAINAFFNRLTKSAPQGSVAAADIAAFKSALYEAYSQSPGRAAASENEGNRRPEIPQ